MNKSINRWIAPFIGLFVGAAIGLKLAIRENQPFQWHYTLLSAGMGFLAGCILLLVDRPTAEKIPSAISYPGRPASDSTSQQASNNIGRVVFVFLILFFFFPLVGSGLGIASLILNRNWQGWPRWINWSLSAIAFVMTIVFVFFLAFAS